MTTITAVDAANITPGTGGAIAPGKEINVASRAVTGGTLYITTVRAAGNGDPQGVATSFVASGNTNVSGLSVSLAYNDTAGHGFGVFLNDGTLSAGDIKVVQSGYNNQNLWEGTIAFYNPQGSSANITVSIPYGQPPTITIPGGYVKVDAGTSFAFLRPTTVDVSSGVLFGIALVPK